MPRKTKAKPGNKWTKRGRGRPKFEPTDEQRRFVGAMAGLKMTWAEIARMIGSASGDGKPLSKTTLQRHFRRELANGSALLRARVASRFHAALDNDAPWAIQMAMRNRFAWDAGRGGFHQDVGALIDDTPMPAAQITFVVPGHGESEIRREPEPAPVPGQRLLPAPVQRIDTPFGAVEWERDPPVGTVGSTMVRRAMNPAYSVPVPSLRTGWENELLARRLRSRQVRSDRPRVPKIDGRDRKTRQHSGSIHGIRQKDQ